MLLQFTKASRLTRFTKAPVFFFSYFDNFTEKINPEPHTLGAFLNPKNHKTDKVRRFNVPLPLRTQKLVDEEKFRTFKQKMIGLNWESKIKMPDDPLWGPEIPTHYVQLRHSAEYYKIKPSEGTKVYAKVLPSELRYKPEITQSLTLQNLPQCNSFNIIQFLLKQQQANPYDHQQNLKVFSLAQKLLMPKLHQIALIDLVRLRHALLGPTRYGTQKLLTSVKKIILQEYESLNIQGLLALFVTQRFEKYKDIQNNVLNVILKEKNLAHFTESNEKLIELIEIFAQYRIPDWKIKRELRVQSQSKIDAISIMSKLPIEETITFLTNQQKIRLMRAFFRMKLEGFKHFLYKIGTTTNQHELTPQEAVEYLTLLAGLQNGEGYINTSQLQTLKPIFLSNWQSYSNYEKLKVTYIYWNLNHSWEEFQPLYQQIPVQADINMLYLFSQIQITDSSSREHEVFRALMEIPVIPVPYFTKLKQFLVLGHTFKWNMLPLIDKFDETETFMNANRLNENLIRSDDVVSLGKFLTIITSNLKHFIPIENFTMIQFVMEDLLIGIETIHKKDIAPNGELKKSAQARNRILENLGWNLVQIRWDQFSKLSINKQHKFIYEKLNEVAEIQKERKIFRQDQESIEINRLASLRAIETWEYDRHEDFMESFRPTQADIDRIGQPGEEEEEPPVVQYVQPEPQIESSKGKKKGKSA